MATTYPTTFLASNLFYGLHPLQDCLKEIFRHTCQGRQRRRLLELPLELIIEILSDLEWHEVLKVRQTCKGLQRASKERPVWLNLFNQLLRDVFTLDYPIKFYTSQELETYTLRFISSDMAWRNNHGKSSLIPPQIPCENSQWYLSDSGRWLLVLDKTGCVEYYDLEYPGIPKRLLIPGFATRTEGELMVANVDRKEANLTFNLAVYSAEDPEEHDSGFRIWCVRLHIDPVDKRPCLTAKRLTSFPRDTPGIVYDMDLRGDIIAYSAAGIPDDDLESPDIVVVIDWKALSQTPDTELIGPHYPKRIIYPGRRHFLQVRLLPDRRLFVLYKCTVRLFHYNDVATTNKYVAKKTRKSIRINLDIDRGFYTPHQWEWSDNSGYSIAAHTLSRTIVSLTSNTVKLVVLWGHKVLGFMIPPHNDDYSNGGDNSLQCVTLVETCEILGERGCHFYGRHKGIIGTGFPDIKPRVLGINYSEPWPDEAAVARDKVSKPKFVDFGPVRSPNRVDFNEFTGRALVFPDRNNMISVLDLAAVPVAASGH